MTNYKTTYFAEITKDNFVMRTKEFNWVDDLLMNVANFIEDISIDATIEIKQVDRTDVNSDSIVSHYKFYDLYQLKDDVKKLSSI